MKITDISLQARDKNRVNVSVDGKFRFSLDIYQVAELGVKVGKEYSEQELSAIETESQFGKLYARTLEYVLMRPHSGREVRDYLYRKTVTRRRLSKKPDKNGDRKVIETPGISKEIADRVYERLVEKKYLDDEKFARWWVENRNVRKGSSLRKISVELRAKGVAADIVDQVISESARNDKTELQKIIAKKRAKYADDQKFMQYLARLGFNYDDIKNALAEN